MQWYNNEVINYNGLIGYWHYFINGVSPIPVLHVSDCNKGQMLTLPTLCDVPVPHYIYGVPYTNWFTENSSKMHAENHCGIVALPWWCLFTYCSGIPYHWCLFDQMVSIINCVPYAGWLLKDREPYGISGCADKLLWLRRCFLELMCSGQDDRQNGWRKSSVCMPGKVYVRGWVSERERERESTRWTKRYAWSPLQMYTLVVKLKLMHQS